MVKTHYQKLDLDKLVSIKTFVLGIQEQKLRKEEQCYIRTTHLLKEGEQYNATIIHYNRLW